MACVILPSETARLVYGYLVKENLNDIALQFLESSPYLMDCCQIVKSGYQFNTKLMGKDLPELLQEYSVIHNLVNTKISNLCKTSLLYKRIKLRCESLPEILELVLFWKYKQSKNEESTSNSDKTEKNISIGSHSEYSKSRDVSQIKISENASDITYSNKNNSNSVQKDSTKLESNHSKLNCETYFISSEIEDEGSSNQNQKNEVCNTENGRKNKDPLWFVPVHSDEVPGSLEKNRIDSDSNRNIHGDTAIGAATTAFSSSDNSISNNGNSNSNNYNSGNENSNNNNNNNNNVVNNNSKCNSTGNNDDCKDNNKNCLPDSKYSNNSSILTIDIDSQCEDLVNNHIPTDSLVPNEEASRFENPIKIVEIQEHNESENHSLGVFPKPLEGGEGNMNLTNSSVVFVSPDVGNVTINQEQSQIIVIPFDYYKAQNGLQNDIGIEINKDLGIIPNDIVNQQTKNNLIFEEGTRNLTSSINPLFSSQNNKSSAVDGNIMTESDFLKNRHLMYNLEEELYEAEPPSQPQISKESKENVSVQTVSGPVIVVSQPITTRPARYRAILPKNEEPVPVHPVVVVHPLLENNKDLTKTISGAVEPFSAAETRREVNRRVKKRSAVSQKAKVKHKKTDKSGNFKGPSEKTAAESKVLDEVKPEEAEVEITSDKQADAEKTNEEKENLEKSENKKNETPIFFTKRNSKRLSLSTPRRRSHIRALEFETPPKTSEDKKKSKTSPKMKIEHLNVERKSVRNTLFKSPIPENTFKSPVVPKEKNKLQPVPSESFKTPEQVEPLNELSIPIATRSPNTKLSDAWENLTGVGCVIGQNDLNKNSPPKKMWDADLRCFILENSLENEPLEKRRIRKPEKNQKDNRKSTKKKVAPPKRIKPVPVTVSPSKISLTAKRNTYSINGNEEGSPIRTLIEDLKIVTPFKDIETTRPTEETPLTKLLRENINTIDIDLSMINTPSFPPTPSIVITPDLDDASMTGTNYYSPMKDSSKDKLLKISDYFKADSEKSNKKDTKEMHEKVIDDLVSKAKEIIGIGKEPQEENSSKRRPSGKILSMVKIQMLTQCDKKLMENIPIYEETTFSNNSSNRTIIGNIIEEASSKTDLKVELEKKRKRALRKIKVVKENLSQTKNRVTKWGRKRKSSANLSKSEKSKSDISKGNLDEQQEITHLTEKQSEILHGSTCAKSDFDKFEKADSDEKFNDKVLEDIRKQFPPFLNDPEKYPELNVKSRKKFHYVENFLKLAEVVKFIDEFSGNNPPKLFLRPSLRRFFHIFYKWLKHPHKRELNASAETKALLKEYLSLFDKVNMGLNRKCKKVKGDKNTLNVSELSSIDSFGHSTGNKVLQSDEDEKEYKRKGTEKRKDEDIEDGVVSTLPLKKRKSTVQQVENKTALTVEKNDTKSNSCENVSQTQNFLQDIDVDRFLSQIHGQETR